MRKYMIFLITLGIMLELTSCHDQSKKECTAIDPGTFKGNAIIFFETVNPEEPYQSAIVFPLCNVLSLDSANLHVDFKTGVSFERPTHDPQIQSMIKQLKMVKMTQDDETVPLYYETAYLELSNIDHKLWPGTGNVQGIMPRNYKLNNGTTLAGSFYFSDSLKMDQVKLK